MKTLAEMIQDRIDRAYGGSQAAFARALGIKTGTLNTIVKGRVALPQADLRRRLARELGIPHVQLFVMAGEISEDELSQAGIQGVVPENPAEAALLPVIRAFEWDEPKLRAAAGALRAIGEMGQGREG